MKRVFVNKIQEGKEVDLERMAVTAGPVICIVALLIVLNLMISDNRFKIELFYAEYVYKMWYSEILSDGKCARAERVPELKIMMSGGSSHLGIEDRKPIAYNENIPLRGLDRSGICRRIETYVCGGLGIFFRKPNRIAWGKQQQEAVTS